MQSNFSLYYLKKPAISVSLGNTIPSRFYKINIGFHFHGVVLFGKLKPLLVPCFGPH